jgi:hypothetical protein
MSVTTQTTPSANYSPKPCRKCGAKELQRKPRRLLHKLFGIYPYVCVKCKKHENKVRFQFSTIIRLLLLVAIPAAIVYFSVHPFSSHRGEDTSQNSADALSRARTTAGGLSAFEQMMIKKPRTTLDNAAILELWKANLGRDVILQMIRTANADYDVSASAIIALKQAGVDQAVILAMIDASYNTR